MDDPTPHLNPETKLLLGLTDEERIAHIQKDSWVGYSRAKSILSEMENLFAHPRIQRMPGLLVVGGTNQGKSTLFRRFAESHPPVDDPARESRSVPVVRIECPPVPDEKRLYHSILDTLGAPYRYSASADVKHQQIKTLFKAVGTRVLLLDELHNVLAGSTNRRQQFINVLKYMANDFGLSIVAAGTSEALNATTSDSQIANRLRPVYLPRWDQDTEFLRLLESFERKLPLWIPSDLQSTVLSEEIHTLSEGILGEAASILKQAACVAIRTKTEQITLEIIRSLGFVRPSKRRTHTESDADDGGV